MLITRTPLRISLDGGGTDLPSYYRQHGGIVVSAAIDKYVFIGLNRTFTDDYFIRYTEFERTRTVGEIRHPIVREALSNAILRDGAVYYDKRPVAEAPGMEWIDYGLSVTSADIVADRLPHGGRGDLSELFHVLSKHGNVAGFEVTERFYEIGSPAGLIDLKDHLRQKAAEAVRD